MPDLRLRLRAVVETVVPWFDRAAFDRERTANRQDIALSKRIREAARQEILRGSFARAGERLVR